MSSDRDERADVRQAVTGQTRQSLEVSASQVTESDGQDVELALLDEREEQPERAIERLEVDLRGRLLDVGRR